MFMDYAFYCYSIRCSGLVNLKKTNKTRMWKYRPLNNRRNTQFPEQELFVEIEVCTWWHCEVANSIRYADGQILYWKNSLISHFWGHLEKHVPRFRLIDAELIHQTECNTFHFTSSNNSRYINAKIRFSTKNYQIGRLD